MFLQLITISLLSLLGTLLGVRSFLTPKREHILVRPILVRIHCPKILTVDRETENGSFAPLQRMFRHECEDEFARETPFM